MSRWLSLLLALCLAGAALAEPVVPENVDQARYRALIAELRCLVCQNQSLADSNAELATDMRREVLHQMEQGATDEEIVNFLVARYGDFVRYRPPVSPNTWLLWFGPFVFLILALSVVIVLVRRRAARPRQKLSEAEHRRARETLERLERERDR